MKYQVFLKVIITSLPRKENSHVPYQIVQTRNGLIYFSDTCIIGMENVLEVRGVKV